MALGASAAGIPDDLKEAGWLTGVGIAAGLFARWAAVLMQKVLLAWSGRQARARALALLLSAFWLASSARGARTESCVKALRAG
jgi:hypothetical protein